MYFTPGNWNFLTSNTEKFLIFQQAEIPKKFFMFQEMKLSNITVNFLYFSS